jgi:hypothetical protein
MRLFQGHSNYFSKHSPWEAERRLAGQEMLVPLRNRKFHCREYKSLGEGSHTTAILNNPVLFMS